MPTFPVPLALQVCLNKFIPRPNSRLKTCPEMVPVHAMTANPIDERLELLYRSPSELPTAMSEAPNITGFICSTVDEYSIRSTIVPAAVDSHSIEHIMFSDKIVHCRRALFDSVL